jgi:hypothetical protein
MAERRRGSVRAEAGARWGRRGCRLAGQQEPGGERGGGDRQADAGLRRLDDPR